MIKVLQLILCLSLLVLVHEFGHYLFARLFGMRVEKFYLFFNPRFSIFKMRKIRGKWRFAFGLPNNVDPVSPTDDDRLHTEWGIGWIPLGGYCKIGGMVDESLDDSQYKSPARPDDFRAHPAWQRFFVMFGGVLMNFILAVSIYSGMLCRNGEYYLRFDETPLKFAPWVQSLGFRNGDKIISADGIPLDRLSESALFDVLKSRSIGILRGDSSLTIPIRGKRLDKRLMQQDTKDFVTLLVAPVVDSVSTSAPAHALLRHDDKVLSVNHTPILSIDEIAPLLRTFHPHDTVTVSIRRGQDTLSLAIPLDAEGRIGFYARPLPWHKASYTPFGAIARSFQKGTSFIASYARQFSLVFTPSGAKEIGGLGTMGNLFPSYWSSRAFWDITAFLSLILAFMNILPIPALDGGHILFILYEIIFRRKPSEEFLERAQICGMLFLFTLMLWANGMDLFRWLK